MPGPSRAKQLNRSVRYVIGQCRLGAILVARNEVGVCAISLGDNGQTLIGELRHRFTNAQPIDDDIELTKALAKLAGYLNDPTFGLQLPLDIQGTPFQLRVWQALREIPMGSTATYTEIAQRIGAPKSARAVARACAANTLAIAIPCHRVVRSDGSLSGYRWGMARKFALLKKELGGALPMRKPSRLARRDAAMALPCEPT